MELFFIEFENTTSLIVFFKFPRLTSKSEYLFAMINLKFSSFPPIINEALGESVFAI